MFGPGLLDAEMAGESRKDGGSWSIPPPDRSPREGWGDCSLSVLDDPLLEGTLPLEAMASGSP